MKKYIFAMVLVVGVLTFAGCAQKNPEPLVRERANSFTQLLVDEKFDDAVSFYDPDLVVQQGRASVAGAFKFAIGLGKGLNQLGGRKGAGFEVRTIDFDAQKTRASIQVVYLSTDANGGDRKEFPTEQKWALKNGVWYNTK